MRYPLTNKTRQSVIVAVLLLAVGALATAAAHVSRSGMARGDIALVEPVPDRAPVQLGRAGSPTVAPLFARGLAVAETRRASAADGAGAFVAGAAAGRFNLVPENRLGGSSSFRDFAGERARNRNTRSASSGSRAFGGGGGGFGGGGWGGASGTARDEGAAAPARQSSRPAQSATRAGGGSSGNGNSNSNGAIVVNAGPGPAVVTLPATAAAPAVAAVNGGPAAPGSFGDSPGGSPTPEPLTLLLVGSGLAGLYGVRRHLA